MHEHINLISWMISRAEESAGPLRCCTYSNRSEISPSRQLFPLTIRDFWRILGTLVAISHGTEGLGGDGPLPDHRLFLALTRHSGLSRWMAAAVGTAASCLATTNRLAMTQPGHPVRYKEPMPDGRIVQPVCIGGQRGRRYAIPVLLQFGYVIASFRADRPMVKNLLTASPYSGSRSKFKSYKANRNHDRQKR
jgi:hypothetical protein